MSVSLRRLCAGTALALCGAFAQAYDYEAQFDATDPTTWPVLAIIIDDLGDRAVEGRRTVALPGPVACSLLPHTPYARELAATAHQSGKEVMLHQPLEADAQNELLGPGAITAGQSGAQITSQLQANLATLPHVSGVNNHMGSRLTRVRQPMHSLLSEIKRTPSLFFVDSVTTQDSIAYAIARELNVPTARRDVFLDSDQDPERIAVQIEKLKKHARERGYAVGIGHPYAVTLDALEAVLPRLAQTGYRLVTVRELIDVQSHRRRTAPRVVRAGGVEATHYQGD